jgi:putative mycofactocin binding protein MftB
MNTTAAPRLRLDPNVALRPEPFGAMAYHYGNRRLLFLRSLDMVRVVEAFGEGATIAAALDAAGIAEPRRASFEAALDRLRAASVLTPVGEPAC